MPKGLVFFKKGAQEMFVYVQEFILTLDKIQNKNDLTCKKIGI